MHLGSYGSGEIAEDSDPNAVFKSWNLCICGGSGYELAAGYNPVAWSCWIIAEEYFKTTDVTPFIGPGLMRVGGCGHAAAPC
jgi:hypothetical protein